MRGEGFARNESAEAVGDDVHDIPELHDPCCERDDDDRCLPGVQPVGAGGIVTRMGSSASCA